MTVPPIPTEGGGDQNRGHRNFGPTTLIMPCSQPDESSTRGRMGGSGPAEDSPTVRRRVFSRWEPPASEPHAGGRTTLSPGQDPHPKDLLPSLVRGRYFSLDLRCGPGSAEFPGLRLTAPPSRRTLHRHSPPQPSPTPPTPTSPGPGGPRGTDAGVRRKIFVCPTRETGTSTRLYLIDPHRPRTFLSRR